MKITSPRRNFPQIFGEARGFALPEILRFLLLLGLVSTAGFAAAPNWPAIPQSASAQQGQAQPASTETLSSPASSGAAASSTASVSSHPISSPNTLAQAIALYRNGNFAAAIAKYQQLVQENPHSPDGYAGLVRSYLRQRDVEQAAQAAETGLAQADSPRVQVAHDEVLFREGHITDAEREWVEVINSGRPEARAYLGVARVRTAIAMYKSARQMVEQAHEIDPYDPDIQQEWVRSLSLAERIKSLQELLSGPYNLSADEREDDTNYLEFLQSRSKEKRESCRLISKVSATETPLNRLLIDKDHLRGYGLPVVLNGHKSVLMLDTGASGILVKRSIAERAGISKISSTKVWGIGSHGRRDAFTGITDSIKIGELEFQNCPIEVMESRSVADEDGLIGADVFESFLVEIDFPNEKLKLSQLPRRPNETEQKLTLKNEEDDSDDPDADDAEEKTGDKSAKSPAPAGYGPQDRYIAPEMQSYTRVFRFHHDLLVPTSIGKVPPKLFLMDTGAFRNSISPAAAREVTKVHGDSDMTVKGLSGQVDKVFSANKATLQFGNLRQENQDMTAFDTKSISDSVGTEVSGFLGFTTLRFLDIKIDYRDALVDFKFDRKRFGQ